MGPKFDNGSSRERLLKAAKHLFATRGYEDTSTAMIARAAGSSESQLVKHFGGKGGLLQAVFEDGWAMVNAHAAANSEGESPAAQLHALLLRTVEGMSLDTELKELMMLEGRRVRSGHGVMITDGFRHFAARIDELVKDMESRGQLKSGLHPRAIRSALVGLIEGVAREEVIARRLHRPSAYDPHELGKVLSAFLESIVAEPEMMAAD